MVCLDYLSLDYLESILDYLLFENRQVSIPLLQAGRIRGRDWRLVTSTKHTRQCKSSQHGLKSPIRRWTLLKEGGLLVYRLHGHGHLRRRRITIVLDHQLHHDLI